MAITIDLVSNAPDHLDEVTKALFISYFRQLELYRKNAAIFSLNLVTKINAADGTVQGRILNAIMREITNLGVGEVEIRGDKDAVWWNQSKERQALLETAFLTLYDDIAEALSNSSGIIPSRGLYGDFAIGQRPQYWAACGYYTSCSPNAQCFCGGCIRKINSYGY